MRQLQVPRTDKSCPLHDPDCAIKLLQFQATSHVLVPGTSITIREGCVPVRASHGKRVTYERLNADLSSWEYKGGACKSVDGRVMFKPCMCFMLHALHFLLAQDAPLHLD